MQINVSDKTLAVIKLAVTITVPVATAVVAHVVERKLTNKPTE